MDPITTAIIAALTAGVTAGLTGIAKSLVLESVLKLPALRVSDVL